MPTYRMPTYRRNFIDPVIFRLDFPVAIESLLAGERPTEFQRAILGAFPVPEDSPRLQQMLEMTPAGVRQVQHREWTRFQFYDADRGSAVTLEPSFLAIEEKNYRGFQRFRGLLELVVNQLFQVWPQTAVNRIGLRYVNKIEPEDGDPLDWGMYINEALIAALQLLGDPDSLSRLVITAEFRGEDYRARVRAGLPNPDFPGLIRRKQFLLDIDVYQQQAIDESDIMGMVDAFHDIATRHFESSITDGLREYLDRE